jgi:altronate dehydratase small subunit
MKSMILNPKDNIGVALTDLESGTKVDLKMEGKTIHVELQEAIGYQHKFSIAHIDSGHKIIKYGEAIGEATKDIRPGQHVHMHNMIGLRAKAAKKQGV